jgi:cytochrome c peroxidase
MGGSHPETETRRLFFGLTLIIAAVVLPVTGRTTLRANELVGADGDLDRELRRVLAEAGFTGTIESQLEARLARPLDPRRADLGRRLFFDNVLGLHSDNSCAGCHAPAFGFGDSQRMAIGVDNNGIVGPGRQGPRNQRRSPLVANTEFYPALMWTPRFVAISGDPFDSPEGFQFPPPEIVVQDPAIRTILQAQASLPSTELVEMAGFTGITENPGPFTERHFVFDDGHGLALPAPDETGFHNFPIQDAVDARLNAIPEYLRLFGEVFNAGVPLPPGGITINMRRLAIAEFQMSLPGADAPIDRYARGDDEALTARQKRGALLFFGPARCVSCHAVAGSANEMFSDFKAHRIGGPQVFPAFGPGTGNTIFDGAGENEDFGFEQTTGDRAKRYMFRTAPLRNVGALAPGFFHNGAFGSLEAAVEHHLDVLASARNYKPGKNRLPTDLFVGPIEPVAGIDPLLATPIQLTRGEFKDLVSFVGRALLDERVLEFCKLVPKAVPSGLPMPLFEGCEEEQLE